MRRDLERRLRALEAAKLGVIEVLFTQPNGMMRGPGGEELPPKEAKARWNAIGRRVFIISQVDANL